MSDPWDTIGAAPSPGSLTIRRADAGHPLEWFRGKDVRGRYVFILEIGDDTVPTGKLPTPGSIAVSIVPGAPGRSHLVLALETGEQVDVFRALCADLMEATRGLRRDQTATGVSVVLNRLRRWQELLKERGTQRLSVREQIGLFGELLFMRDEVLERLSPSEAIRAWRGAHRDEQDFSLGEWNVEVKTQLSTADRVLRISSLEQLDPGPHGLVLCHQTLGNARQEQPGALSLNGLVRVLDGRISGVPTSVRDIFVAGLMTYGYLASEEYDEPLWIPAGRQYFEVTGDFPRLVPGTVPAGIARVRYLVDVATCLPFELDAVEALRKVFGHEC